MRFALSLLTLLYLSFLTLFCLSNFACHLLFVGSSSNMVSTRTRGKSKKKEVVVEDVDDEELPSSCEEESEYEDFQPTSKKKKS